jgi:hypothetical protein
MRPVRSSAVRRNPLLDLDAHLHPQLGVEVRQRLVEQEHLRIADDGAAHRDALALAAGKLAGKPFQIGAQSEDFGGALHPRVDLRFRRAAQPQRKAHVRRDRHVRIERVVLEHHGDVALLGRQVVHHPVADADFAGGDVLQSRDHAQQGGLAAAGRADQDDELAIANGNVDAMNDGRRAKGLADIVDRDRRHTLSRWRAAPRCRLPSQVAFRAKHVAPTLMKSRANAITQTRLWARVMALT